MSTYRIDPLEYSNPPPAYNDREFDQKTSLATEASLQTPRPPTPEISEERWAEIEEAAFQAAIAASLADSTPTESFSIPDQGQPSRTIEPGPPSPTRNRSPVPTTAPRRFPTVKPLRIEKKTRSPNASVDLKHEKEKNKWITEEESAYPSQAGSSSHGHGDYEDDIAPPPFAETAPHGSQYHEPGFHDVGYNPPHSAGRPSATIPSADISPNLLLQSLDSLSISSAIFSDHQPTAHPLPPPPPPAPSHGNNRQSMPVSPSQEPTACRTVHRTRSFTPQPSSSFVDPSSTHQAMNAPMMHFNPSVAYGKSPFARLQTPPPPGMEEGQEVVYRANAFYNAAVSAHLTPKTPSQRSTGDQRPSYARNHSFHNGYNNSCSTASSPGYATTGNPSGITQGHQHPYTAAPTPTDPNWGQPFPGSNRPMSVHSMDTVYSSSAVSQPQYLNTFQPTPQHGGAPQVGWAAAGSQQFHANRYGQW